MDDLTKKIDKAKIRIITRFPFFGTLMMKRSIAIENSVPTAAARSDGSIVINPHFAETLSVDNLVFLICHEILHHAFSHLARVGNRDITVYNVAADVVINYVLSCEEVGGMIDGAVTYSNAGAFVGVPDVQVDPRDTSEDIYDKLMKAQEQEGNAGKNGEGNSSGGNSNRENPVNDLTEDQVIRDSNRAAEAEAQAKRDLAEAMTVARQYGSGPSSTLRNFVEGLLYKKVPWWEKLEEYMTGKARSFQSFNRPNKRYPGVNVPVVDKTECMGEVGIVVDMSGSIGPGELAEMLSHVNDILSQCKPSKVHIVYTTHRVEHTESYEHDELPSKLNPYNCSGGTDMCKGVAWVEDNAEDPDVCIILTDGYTPYPTNPCVDTVWVINNERQTSPVGVTFNV